MTHVSLVPVTSFRSATHSYGLPEAIELGKALNQLQPHVIVYGIEGKAFDAGTGLSIDVERAAERVVQIIVREVGGRSRRFSHRVLYNL